MDDDCADDLPPNMSGCDFRGTCGLDVFDFVVGVVFVVGIVFDEEDVVVIFEHEDDVLMFFEND